MAWLAVHTNKTAVAELMRIAWRTVGWICERVMAEQRAGRDLFAGLERIGIDEISIRKGQRYLTVVVDHDTGRLVWAAAGRDKQTVTRFLDLLGDERCQRLKLVSCDMASWITGPIASAAPTRPSATTRSTSSSSRPTRSTTSAARSGTRLAARATGSSPPSSKERGSCSGRTPAT